MDVLINNMTDTKKWTIDKNVKKHLWSEKFIYNVDCFYFCFIYLFSTGKVNKIMVICLEAFFFSSRLLDFCFLFLCNAIRSEEEVQNRVITFSWNL